MVFLSIKHKTGMFLNFIFVCVASQYSCNIYSDSGINIFSICILKQMKRTRVGFFPFVTICSGDALGQLNESLTSSTVNLLWELLK